MFGYDQDDLFSVVGRLLIEHGAGVDSGIADDARGAGIARELLATAIEWLRQRGAPRVVLWTAAQKAKIRDSRIGGTRLLAETIATNLGAQFVPPLRGRELALPQPSPRSAPLVERDGELQGDRLLLNGKMLTGRDAAHKRIQEFLEQKNPLPVDFTNRVIYYVGPVDPVREEVVGPAGPTTATRMDKFTDTMLGRTGLIAMVGKGERGPAAVESIRKHKAAYLMAVGGAAYLVAKAIRKSRVLAFADLGMEAIYEFEVQDMPVTVAVDSKGESVHATGPAEWSKKIVELKIPVTAA